MHNELIRFRLCMVPMNANHSLPQINSANFFCNEMKAVILKLLNRWCLHHPSSWIYAFYYGFSSRKCISKRLHSTIFPSSVRSSAPIRRTRLYLWIKLICCISIGAVAARKVFPLFASSRSFFLSFISCCRWEQQFGFWFWTGVVQLSAGAHFVQMSAKSF